jgi:hypothetical protein
MPKMSKDFPSQISLGVSVDMRQRLVALGYMLGSGGQYAGAVRNMLHNAMIQYVDGLNEKQRAEYESILLNVKAREIK